jgi:hypothetical protein
MVGPLRERNIKMGTGFDLRLGSLTGIGFFAGGKKAARGKGRGGGNEKLASVETHVPSLTLLVQGLNPVGQPLFFLLFP